MLHTFLALIKKDLTLEFRGKDSLIVMTTLSILFCVIFGAGVRAAFLTPHELQKLYPSLLWIIFVVTATITLERSIDSELEDRAYEGVILTGAPYPSMYLSRVIASSVTVFTVHSFTTILLALLTGVHLMGHLPRVFVISLAVVPAYCALAVLTVSMTATARLRSSVLPLILLPLLFPLFFAAIELTSQLLLNNELRYTSFWFTLLLVLDLIYLALGANLYRFALSD